MNKQEQKNMLDKATIEKYYGTVEAYLEEQRRTAVVEFENVALAEELNSKQWIWDYTRSGRTESTPRPRRRWFTANQ